MNKLMAAMVAGLFCVSMAQAQDKKPTAKPTSQQEKMGFCNKEAAAKQLKGDERKKFMSECLKA